MIRARKEIQNKMIRVFAANLAHLRKERGWSMSVAAGHLGVAASTWSQWESGVRFPPARLMVLLPTLFGVVLCRLFGDDLTCPLAQEAGRKNRKNL